MMLQGGGLSTMVAQMTYGKKQFEQLDATIRPLLPPLHDATVAAVAMIDKDTDAFTQYMVTSIQFNHYQEMLPALRNFANV